MTSPGDLFITKLLHLSSELVIEYIRERLQKIRGRMKSLNFGASVAPRIAQAASQSHTSNVEISRSSEIEGKLFTQQSEIC
jgi:hypothetical protein